MPQWKPISISLTRRKPLVWERELGTKDFGIELDWIVSNGYHFIQILYPDLSRQIRRDWQKREAMPKMTRSVLPRLQRATRLTALWTSSVSTGPPPPLHCYSWGLLLPSLDIMKWCNNCDKLYLSNALKASHCLERGHCYQCIWDTLQLTSRPLIN